MEYNYEKDYVNAATGFMFRYICSETERMVEHWHDYFEIFLILEGSIIHNVNGMVQELSEGTLVFIRPGDVHKYSCNNKEKVHFLNLTVSKSTMSRLMDYFGSAFDKNIILGGIVPPTVIVSKEKSDEMLRKFEQINTFEMEDIKSFKLHMRTYLAEIVSSCFFDVNTYSQEEVEMPNWLSEVCSKMYIKENFVEGSSRMIELSGKTREHLTKSLKRYLGVSLSEYICNLRLNYAANMLINSNINVLDLCYDCGFDNTGYFYRKFNQRYGTSPLTFRKANLITK